ncbi:acyltransferase [Enterococcus faecium]
MKRNYSIDLIKSSAVFFVVSVHFLLNSGFYDEPIQSNLMIFWMLTRQLTITAVPLFLLSTGFLMNKKQLSVAYLKNLFPVLFLYISISIFDWICSCFTRGEISQNFTEAIFGLFDYSTDSYSWYVEMYIGLYLVIPLLNLIWQSNKNLFFHHYIVGVSLLLFFMPSLLNSFGKVIPDFWVPAYPIGYYFIGAYLAEYQEDFKKMKKTGLFLLMMIICFFFIDLLINRQTNYQDFDGNQYSGFEPLIISVLFFIFCLNRSLPHISHCFLKRISTGTLGIYLMSDVTDKLIYSWAEYLFPTVEARLRYGYLFILLSFIGALILSFPFEYGKNKLQDKMKEKKTLERKKECVSTKIY